MLRLAVLGLLAGAILSAHAQACVHAYGVYAMPACRVFASAPSDALGARVHGACSHTPAGTSARHTRPSPHTFSYVSSSVLVAPVDSHSLPMVRGAWRAYTSALKSQPLRTNVVTSGVITVAGDTMAQLVAHEKRDETAPAGEQKRSAGAEVLSKVEAKGTSRIEGGRGLDLQRSASMLGWGTIVSGGALYYWFRFLDHLFPPHQNTLMYVHTLPHTCVPRALALERVKLSGAQPTQAGACQSWRQSGRTGLSAQWSILRRIHSSIT